MSESERVKTAEVEAMTAHAHATDASATAQSLRRRVEELEETICAALGQGADEALWPPGMTYVEALKRLPEAAVALRTSLERIAHAHDEHAQLMDKGPHGWSKALNWAQEIAKAALAECKDISAVDALAIVVERDELARKLEVERKYVYDVIGVLGEFGISPTPGPDRLDDLKAAVAWRLKKERGGSEVARVAGMKAALEKLRSWFSCHVQGDTSRMVMVMRAIDDALSPDVGRGWRPPLADWPDDLPASRELVAFCESDDPTECDTNLYIETEGECDAQALRDEFRKGHHSADVCVKNEHAEVARAERDAARRDVENERERVACIFETLTDGKTDENAEEAASRVAAELDGLRALRAVVEDVHPVRSGHVLTDGRVCPLCKALDVLP